MSLITTIEKTINRTLVRLIWILNLDHLKACSDGKPVQRTTERMHPLQYYSGLQKHPGMWRYIFCRNKTHNASATKLVYAVILVMASYKDFTRSWDINAGIFWMAKQAGFFFFLSISGESTNNYNTSVGKMYRGAMWDHRNNPLNGHKLHDIVFALLLITVFFTASLAVHLTSHRQNLWKTHYRWVAEPENIDF